LQDHETFAKEIYRLILQGGVDPEALQGNLKNLATGTRSRVDILAITADSLEVELKLSPFVALHFGKRNSWHSRQILGPFLIWAEAENKLSVIYFTWATHTFRRSTPLLTSTQLLSGGPIPMTRTIP
jgi:hypothetical protein